MERSGNPVYAAPFVHVELQYAARETMLRNIKLLTVGLVVFSLTGCSSLKEVRSKSKFGPIFKHSGTKRTDSVQWSVQQGVEFKWKGGVKTGIAYRRRDVDEGNGNGDNAVFVNFSFPLWKAPKKPSKLKKRMKKMEKRVAELEALLKEEGQK